MVLAINIRKLECKVIRRSFQNEILISWHLFPWKAVLPSCAEKEAAGIPAFNGLLEMLERKTLFPTA
jgi:hypothetical protein